MGESARPRRGTRRVALMVALLVAVNLTVGFMLTAISTSSLATLIRMRMLDVANSAAAMIDGDALRSLTPADAGTEGYESIMGTLACFQDNVSLEYIYCIRDMGDGTFSFGLDPTVEDPAEFGSPVVSTDALVRASKGVPAADERPYEDEWGTFYSAYSPVFDAAGDVAGIVAVDFDAGWYDRQISTITWTVVVGSLMSLLAGGAIVVMTVRRSERRIDSIHGQLSDLECTLMQEMGSQGGVDAADAHAAPDADEAREGDALDELERHIQSMQTELASQAAQMQSAAYRDVLTGARNKYAFLEAQERLERRLAAGPLEPFAVVVCDVNGLKQVNDTIGHQAGDAYIRDACRMVQDAFADSTVYRIGGDEFVVVLTGADYERRRVHMHELHRLSVAHIATGEAVVACGLSEFVAGEDSSVQDAFGRADRAMYEEKALLKRMGSATRDAGDEEPLTDEDVEDVPLPNVRRALLIADDVRANREILGELLSDDYDIHYAADGVETMSVLERHRDEIALLVLDLHMPNMSGFEVMARMQADEELMSIPVVVLTVDREAELDSLRIGAMDFLPKPYPEIEIVKARIARCIELSESRELIRSTQRDRLTGLFNLDCFLRYVRLLDQQSGGAAFDAIVVEVAGFRELRARQGGHYANLVARSVGLAAKRLARRTRGVGGRADDGTFCVYCPHQDDLDGLLSRFSDDVFVEEETAERVRLMIGALAHAQAEPIAEERFTYARLAADVAGDDPGRTYAIYEL